jgi:hypothetical protein
MTWTLIQSSSCVSLGNLPTVKINLVLASDGHKWFVSFIHQFWLIQGIISNILGQVEIDANVRRTPMIDKFVRLFPILCIEVGDT